MKQRLQNRIAESSVTLPFAIVVATLLWWLPQGRFSTFYLYGWLTFALATYAVMELSARNALLRIRSRMISSVFVLLVGTFGFLHPFQEDNIVMLLMAFFLFSLMGSYEKTDKPAYAFYATLFFSLSSIIWAPLLLFFPIILFCQAHFMRCLSMRTFGADIIGILFPYWIWLTVAMLLGRTTELVTHLSTIISPFSEPFYWQWVIDLAYQTDWHGFQEAFPVQLNSRLTPYYIYIPKLSALILTLLLGLTGLVHYSRKNFDDKTRVRMCYNCMLLMQVVLTLWLLIQPQHFNILFPMLLLTSVPAAAHFFALTHTFLTNLWFIICSLLIILVGVCNLAPIY